VTSRNGPRTVNGPGTARRARVRSLQPTRTLRAEETLDTRERARDAEANAPRDARLDLEAGDPPESARMDWCAISVAQRRDEYVFQVIKLGPGGRRHVLTTSPSFRQPWWARVLRLRGLPNLGEPRHTHATLVRWLMATGWRQRQTRGRWHDAAFVRPRHQPQR
jgi:hypothetical protein